MRTSTKALSALLIGLMFGCAKTEADQPVRSAPVVRGATVAAVTRESIPELSEAVGSIKARHYAAVAARIAGSVTRVFVTEGEHVATGKTLVTIESAESGAAAAGALSGVEEAERGLEEARARKKLADATFARFKKLYEEQAVTRQEFEERQMEQETSAQGVARAEARLSQARQGAKAAGAVAGYGKVSAPIAGVVVSKQVEAGQTVFPGTPLMTIEAQDGLRLEVAAPESLTGKVHAGDRVAVVLEGAPQGSGTVSEVVPTVDPASRTFLVKIDVAGKGLRSGSYGKALFATGMRQGIVLPQRAVIERGGLTSVWAVTTDGVARLRLVKLGKSIGERVEVISGLDPGEKVVIAGADKVVDGAKVQ